MICLKNLYQKNKLNIKCFQQYWEQKIKKLILIFILCQKVLLVNS